MVNDCRQPSQASCGRYLVLTSATWNSVGHPEVCTARPACLGFSHWRELGAQWHGGSASEACDQPHASCQTRSATIHRLQVTGGRLFVTPTARHTTTSQREGLP